MGLSTSREFSDLGQGAAEVYASYGRADQQQSRVQTGAVAVSSSSPNTPTPHHTPSPSMSSPGHPPLTGRCDLAHRPAPPYVPTHHATTVGTTSSNLLLAANPPRTHTALSSLPPSLQGHPHPYHHNHPSHLGSYPPHHHPHQPPHQFVPAGAAESGHLVPIPTTMLDPHQLGTPTPAVPPAEETPDVVPVVLSWNFGGSSVFVTGAWDGWREKIPLSRDNQTFVVVLYLPIGQTFQFKYFVDQNWMCNPSLPTETDLSGNTNNVIAVEGVNPEFDSLDPVDETTAPDSPLSSYDQSIPDFDATVASPLSMPDAMLNPRLPPSSHVLIDHLFVEGPHSAHCPKSGADYSPRCLLATPPPLVFSAPFRHKDKLISAIFVLSGSFRPNPQPSNPSKRQNAQYTSDIIPLFSV